MTDEPDNLPAGLRSVLAIYVVVGLVVWWLFF